MSHAVLHNMPQMTNERALCQAFEKLGWKIHKHAHIRTWSSNDRKKTYDHVARNPGHLDRDYDFGIVCQPQGELALEGDTSMMGADVWQSLGGREFSLLKKEYTTASLAEEVSQMGGTMVSQELGNGTRRVAIELEVEL